MTETAQIILGIAGSITTMITVIVTAWINNRNNTKQNTTIVNKVDDVKREVNGNLHAQIKAAKQLGRLEERKKTKAGK